LPDKCTLKVALRYAPSQTKESMVEDIQAMLNEISSNDKDFSANVEILGAGEKPSMPPFEIDESELIVETVKEAHRHVTGLEPKIGDIAPYKFYGTDAAHLSEYGIKGIIYGCGGKYNTMPDERVELSDLKTATKVYTLAIQDICN